MIPRGLLLLLALLSLSNCRPRPSEYYIYRELRGCFAVRQPDPNAPGRDPCAPYHWQHRERGDVPPAGLPPEEVPR